MSTVLYVDDSDALRELVQEQFAAPPASEHQLSVLESGTEAIMAIRNGIRFDIIVTDLEMLPGPDGVQVVREARLKNPQQLIVICSGNPDAARNVPEGVPVLEKVGRNIRKLAEDMLAGKEVRD